MAITLSTINSLPTSSTGLFIDKLKDWKFNIPSKNLWTVNIFPHNDGTEINGSLSKLYQNIANVNKIYDAQIGTAWSVKSNTTQEFDTDFISKLEVDQTALFLAQGLSYETHSATVNTNVSDMLVPHAGYMTFGSISNGKSPAHTLNIQFLETNWNIGDILFERWIAAYIQQGGIEDSSLPNIKADIFVNEYAHGAPESLKKRFTDEWQLRKTIKFIKCVPVKRSGDTMLTSEPPNSPNILTVEFNYQDYNISYAI